MTDLEGQLAGVTAQVTALRQEKGRLTAVLQAEKSRAEVLEEEKQKCAPWTLSFGRCMPLFSDAAVFR